MEKGLLKKGKGKKLFLDLLIITVGVALLGIAITVFFQPNELVTGGVTGIGIMVEEITKGLVPVAMTNLILNIPLILLGMRIKGREFIIKTLYATITVSAAIVLAKLIPPIQNMDDLLAAIFGGGITGIGLGLVIRSNSTTGGTDLAATLLQHYQPHLPVQNIIMIIEFVIIGLGMFLFGPAKGMYAMIAIFVQTKMMDITLNGLGFAKAAFVITNKPDEISQCIVEELERSATIIDSHGAYKKTRNNVILCVLPSKKLVELRKIVARKDTSAFIIVADVTEVYGEGYEEHFVETR